MWEELQEVRDDARKIPLQYLNKETKLDAVRLMTKVNLTYRGVADSSDVRRVVFSTQYMCKISRAHEFALINVREVILATIHCDFELNMLLCLEF